MLPSEILTFVENTNRSTTGPIVITNIDFDNAIHSREVMGSGPTFHIGTCTVSVRAQIRKRPGDKIYLTVEAESAHMACARLMRMLEAAA